MDIANIRTALYSHYPCPRYYASPPTKTSPLKTPTRNNMRSHKGTYFAVTPPTFSTITGILNAIVAVTSTEYIRVYSAITVSIYINIVHEKITDMAKDV